MRIETDVANPGGRPGMTVQISLDTARTRNAVTIPPAADALPQWIGRWITPEFLLQQGRKVQLRFEVGLTRCTLINVLHGSRRIRGDRAFILHRVENSSRF